MRKNIIIITIMLATIATSYGQVEKDTKKTVNTAADLYSPADSKIVDLLLSGTASEDFVDGFYELYITTIDADEDVYQVVYKHAINDTLEAYDDYMGVYAASLKDYLLDDSEHEKVFIVPKRPPQ